MKFEELNIDKDVLKVINEMKFSEMTEIQEKALPLIKAGEDVIGESATGSGKTLAFAIHLIEKSVKAGSVQSLVLVPTRELCEQVSKEIRKFSKYKGLNIASIYGGVSYAPQKDMLKKSEIVVGTPGRILDHIRQGTFETHNIRIFVIDEVDRMLDMGFIHDVDQIIKNIPLKRQTLLFSATIDSDIEYLARKYMKNSKLISAENHVDPLLLRQYYYDVPGRNKFSLFVHLLKNDRTNLVIVFCNTRHNVDFLSRNLRKQGINARSLHGGLTQSRRNNIMDMFRASDINVLVASDVAARGLDIKNVSHVYNYDMPKTQDEYIHRIGRTARAGKEGKAISVVSERDYDNFSKIIRDIPIERLETPKFDRVVFIAYKKEGFGDRNRGRRFDRQNIGRRKIFFKRRRFVFQRQ
ncbi:DEAD/DEAH box helicase [Candidatus Pacearchaeota archaeon]|nr:DEAD/DEAH box helicase [Candidatus Pacearchaeota archaeon]